MPLGMEVGLDPGHFLFVGDPPPSQKKGTSPQSIFGPCLLWPNGWMDQDANWYGGKPRPSSPVFGSCLVCCGQTAEWTKMSLGMEVGLSPGDFVFVGDPALS